MAIDGWNFDRLAAIFAARENRFRARSGSGSMGRSIERFRGGCAIAVVLTPRAR
jgi:hypothetical protein